MTDCCHDLLISNAMRRIFPSSDAQRTYDDLMRARPLRTAAGIGEAFFFGYENPYSEGLPNLCGRPGSLTRAAWAAGVDSRLQDSRMSGEQRVSFRSAIARQA